MSTDVIFRSATEADLPAIVSLLADDMIGAGREGESGAYLAAFREVDADPRNHLVVAEIDGEVAGTLQLTYIPGISRMGTERAQIEAVRVAAAHRSRGLGREMIAWAIDQARTRGCGLVQLTSDKRRSDAIRFYASLGFGPTHEGLKLSL
ncbi:MAG: GNAT family N-acetyltransferase [Actinoallomurus sp.]